MCELCAAMEDTFREVDDTVSAGIKALASGDIFYVLKAGRCQVTFWDSDSKDRLWSSEVLLSKGLSYPSARWVLNHTSPV